MAPDTTKFVVADLVVARHAQRIHDFSLLVDGKQNIALHSQHQRRNMRQRPHSLCQISEIRRRVDWRGVGIRLKGSMCSAVGEHLGCGLVDEGSEFEVVCEDRGGHIEKVHSFGDVDERVGVILETELFALQAHARVWDCGKEDDDDWVIGDRMILSGLLT